MLLPEHEFLQEGYSGDDTLSPALERLRDLIATGVLDAATSTPDRLARRYAYQVLIIEEWRRAGVKVIFLDRVLGQSPEDATPLRSAGHGGRKRAGQDFRAQPARQTPCGPSGDTERPFRRSLWVPTWKCSGRRRTSPL
jgi:site-specific DNA recombinase